MGGLGGELFVQGVIVARKRPRGRPRKDAAVVEAQIAVEAAAAVEAAKKVAIPA